MGEIMLERVKHTRSMLRKQLVETILNEFDGECMNLDHDQRKEKYKTMMDNPFRFFRGSAYLFYFDMTKIPFSFHTPEDKPTWIQGDLHMENFGAFQNEKGEIVYDVNDFDEGYVGSYLYDVLRMSVSIALYGEAQGLSLKEQKDRIRNFLQVYYDQLKRFKKKKDDPFTFFYTRKNTKGPVHKTLKKLEKRQIDHLLQDITTINEENKRVFAWSDEIQPVSDKERETIHAFWDTYIQSIDKEDQQDRSFYGIKDIARKHGSGTASIGLDRFYILVEGGKDSNGVDDLVLEVKEVRVPIPAYFLPYKDKFWGKYEHQGERVVATQNAMHHQEDPYLGYLTIDDRHYYVRERSPYKKKINAKLLQTVDGLDETLEIMGRITAKIHARADVDFEADLFSHHSEVEILKAIGDNFDIFSTQIIFTSMVYKEQVNQDYELFCRWVPEEFQLEKDTAEDAVVEPKVRIEGDTTEALLFSKSIVDKDSQTEELEPPIAQKKDS